MADYIANKVAHSLGNKKAAQYQPQDPHYETTTDAKGRQKRKTRDLPPGLSPEHAKILKKVRKRAHRLDKGMSLCGLRVGWTFWLGLIPMAGDVADFFLSYNLVIKPASKCDLPPLLRDRMIANQLLATGVGFIPFVGDILMATVKPNSRNAWLLEEYLISKAGKQGGDDQQTAQNVVTTSKGKGFFNKKTGEAGSSAQPSSNGNAAQSG